MQRRTKDMAADSDMPAESTRPWNEASKTEGCTHTIISCFNITQHIAPQHERASEMEWSKNLKFQCSDFVDLYVLDGWMTKVSLLLAWYVDY